VYARSHVSVHTFSRSLLDRGTTALLICHVTGSTSASLTVILRVTALLLKLLLRSYHSYSVPFLVSSKEGPLRGPVRHIDRHSFPPRITEVERRELGSLPGCIFLGIHCRYPVVLLTIIPELMCNFWNKRVLDVWIIED
jgi:hypothetical protein